MARYTCSFKVAVPIELLRQMLVEVLQACNLDIIYDTTDYMMAREMPGQVSFAKLVAVEVLIDKTIATETETRMHLVCKNEELPLQVDNHCRQMFDMVSRALSENRHRHLVESFASR